MAKNDNVILSKQDAGRLQIMLRWFERVGKTLRPQHRRRGVAVSAASGRWFKLNDITANPMTGREQICNNGTFSDANGAGAENTDIYRYPQFTNNTSYKIYDYVFCVYSGNCWISLYNTPHEMFRCS